MPLDAKGKPRSAINPNSFDGTVFGAPFNADPLAWHFNPLSMQRIHMNLLGAVKVREDTPRDEVDFMPVGKHNLRVRMDVPILEPGRTMVHPTRQFSDKRWSWNNDEIDSYNEAARAIMAELAIPINDLHALVTSDYYRFLAADKLHLSETGQQACSDQVLGSIRELL